MFVLCWVEILCDGQSHPLSPPCASSCHCSGRWMEQHQQAARRDHRIHHRLVDQATSVQEQQHPELKRTRIGTKHNLAQFFHVCYAPKVVPRAPLPCPLTARLVRSLRQSEYLSQCSC